MYKIFNRTCLIRKIFLRKTILKRHAFKLIEIALMSNQGKTILTDLVRKKTLDSSLSRFILHENWYRQQYFFSVRKNILLIYVLFFLPYKIDVIRQDQNVNQITEK